MKMKNKSPKKNCLNESSSTYVTPRLSKITFRKGGNDNSFELPHIDEENNVSSTLLDFNPTEDINQLSWPSNDTEHSKSKKKRKKNKDCHELNASQDGSIDMREEKFLGEPDMQELDNSTTNSASSTVIVKKKNKRKSDVSEISSFAESPYNEYHSVINEDEIQISKKKRKKKNKLDILKGDGADERSDKDICMAEVQLAELSGIKKTSSPNEQKKKKKKNSVSVISSMTHNKEQVTDKNESEESVNRQGGGSDSNLPMNILDVPNAFKKKKKKKHLYEESSYQLNIIKDIEIDKLKGVKKTKELNNSSMDNENTPSKKHKNSRFGEVLDVNLNNKDNESSIGPIKTPPISIFKECKRKDSLSALSLEEMNDETDSPLIKKKKKTQKLVNESNLNICCSEETKKVKSEKDINFSLANKDSVQLILSGKKNSVSKLFDKAIFSVSKSENNDRLDKKDNESEGCSNLKIPQTIQSPKSDKEKQIHTSGLFKRKHIWASVDFNEDCEPLMRDDDSNLIKNLGTQNSPIGSTINKHEFKKLSEEKLNQIIKPLASDLKEKKHKKKKTITKNTLLEEKSRTNDEVDSHHSVKNSSSSKTKLVNSSEEKNGKLGSLSPKKKKKNNNNIESLRNQLLKDALGEIKVTKLKLGHGKSTITSKKVKSKKADATKAVTNLPTKPVKLNTDDPDTLRKLLLQDAISRLNEVKHLSPKSSKPKTKKKVDPKTHLLKETVSKGAGNLPHKTSKTKTGVKEDVDTLRTSLLREAIGNTKGPDNLISKSSKPKVREKNNVESLRNQLLKEAVVNPKVSKKAKVTNLKADLPSDNKDSKTKSEKKHKKKHKHNKDEIDSLTNLLLSKALKKVASSSE